MLRLRRSLSIASTAYNHGQTTTWSRNDRASDGFAKSRPGDRVGFQSRAGAATAGRCGPDRPAAR